MIETYLVLLGFIGGIAGGGVVVLVLWIFDAADKPEEPHTRWPD